MMAIKNLNSYLDKHSYKIDEEMQTDLNEYEETEEYEDGHQGILNSDDVLIASDEATYNYQKKEKAKDFLSEKEEEIKKLLLDSIATEEDNGSLINDILGEFDNWFCDNRTADDYYPIWLTAWEFPSSYTAEELNEFDISGIVFFEIKNTIFVSLTACGMDMTPSLEYAYFMYSDIDISKKYVKERIFKQPSYFSGVIGTKDFKSLCEKLGITERKINLAEKRVNERLKEFSKGLDNLSKLRDSGKISQTEAGLLGIMQFLKTQNQEEKEVKQMA